MLFLNHFDIQETMNGKILIITLLAVLNSGCSYLKNVQLLMTGDLETDAPITTLPFQYQKDIILVEANVAGASGIFLLDTAAFDSKIERSFALSIGLQPITTKKVTTAQGIDGEVAVTQIPEFKLGQATFTKTSAGMLTFGDRSATQCIAPQGLIGANLMRRGYWKIDYAAQTLAIAEKPMPIPDNAAQIQFDHPTLSAVPAINMNIAGVEVSGILFDTGYNGALVLPRSLADRFESESSLSILDQSTSGIFGTNQDDILVKELTVELGTTSMNIPVEFSSLNKALLGNEILEHFDIYIDYQQDTLFLVQRSDVTVTPPRTLILGMTDNNEWVVDRTLTTLPFALGDRVRTVNGKKPNEVFGDFCDYFLNLDRLYSSPSMMLETLTGDIIEVPL